MIAYHAPGLATVEAPDGEHVLGALVVVLEHGVGKIRLEGFVHKVQEGMEGPVGVPERESRIVGEIFCELHRAVVSAETAVDILEEEGVLGRAVDAGVEGLFCAKVAGGIKFIFAQFLLPEILRLGAHGLEALAIKFGEILKCPVGAYGGYRHLDAYLLAGAGREFDAGLKAAAPGFERTAEALGVVNHRFTFLKDDEILYRLREARGKIDLAAGVPSCHYLASYDGVVVQQADGGPLALPAEGMVQINHNKRLLALGISETEYAAAGGCGHLGSHPVIGQFNSVIAGGGSLPFVAETGPVAAVRILCRACSRFQSSGAGDEEEVSQIGDAGAAQVGETEAHDRGLVILVAGGNIIVVIVCVRADLYSSEGNLGPRIDVAESVGAYEGVDILNQAFLPVGTDSQCYCQK